MEEVERVLLGVADRAHDLVAPAGHAQGGLAAVGLGGSDGASLWFGSGANAAVNDYDGRGVNHLGISVDSQADVDAFAAYLSGKGVPALFETPRHRPEFAGAEDQTYYQVMFESPDRILFEVVYSGPKQ